MFVRIRRTVSAGGATAAGGGAYDSAAPGHHGGPGVPEVLQLHAAPRPSSRKNIHCDSHETYVVLRVETRKVSLNPRVSVKVKSK